MKKALLPLVISSALPLMALPAHAAELAPPTPHSHAAISVDSVVIDGEKFAVQMVALNGGLGLHQGQIFQIDQIIPVDAARDTDARFNAEDLLFTIPLLGEGRVSHDVTFRITHDNPIQFTAIRVDSTFHNPSTGNTLRTAIEGPQGAAGATGRARGTGGAPGLGGPIGSGGGNRRAGGTGPSRWSSRSTRPAGRARCRWTTRYCRRPRPCWTRRSDRARGQSWARWYIGGSRPYRPARRTGAGGRCRSARAPRPFGRSRPSGLSGRHWRSWASRPTRRARS